VHATLIDGARASSHMVLIYLVFIPVIFSEAQTRNELFKNLLDHSQSQK